MHGWFSLSDSVLLMMIGGTTINVLGIFILAARYLFKTDSMHIQQKKAEEDDGDSVLSGSPENLPRLLNCWEQLPRIVRL